MNEAQERLQRLVECVGTLERLQRSLEHVAMNQVQAPPGVVESSTNMIEILKERRDRDLKYLMKKLEEIAC